MIHVGDSGVILATFDPDSIDACVTDPPYGLSFMGKRWDYQVPGVELWREVFRVLKPGGRLLCFAGTRTMHRMWCNIEDAGFTIEDTIAWMYGSGFPKHRSKLKPAYEPICVARKGGVSELNIDECRIAGSVPRTGQGTSDRIYGGGNGLRPAELGTQAFEPHDSGRWPANVILDVEAARLLDEQSGTLTSGKAAEGGHVRGEPKGEGIYGGGKGLWKEAGWAGALFGDTGGASRFFFVARRDGCETVNIAETSSSRPSGRGGSVPSDAATSDSLAAPPLAPSGHGPACISACESCIHNLSRAFDVEPLASTGTTPITPSFCALCGSVLPATAACISLGSVARAAAEYAPVEGTRFRYEAKASRSERNAGLEGMPAKPGGSTVDGFTEDRARGLDRNRPTENHHPTVKPVDLMRYLVRLVSQPGGLVLDPFTGSGTTGVACVEEGRRFVGCEIDPEYAAIAERRIVTAQPSLFDGAA